MPDRWLFPNLILAGLMISACTPKSSSIIQTNSISTPPQTIRASDTPQPTRTNLPATITPTLTPVILTSTLTPYKIFRISSPLQDIDRNELGSLITNPFDQPPPGSDGGHHGIDLAFYHYKGINGIEGLPVLSILDGLVAAVLPNRYPYGNAVIIETPLTWLPDAWQTQLGAPFLTPTPGTHISMTCPENLFDPSWQDRTQSLYLLYAHLQFAPDVIMDEQVISGQAIARVGNTGGSVNPHLHVELRIGPSGVRFTSMSHYRGDTTDEERRNYCTWRVSGIFSLVNPLTLLTIPDE